MAGLGDRFIFLSHVCIFGWTSLLFITWKARLHQVLNFWMSSEFIWRVSPKIYILGPVLPGSIWECHPGCWRATVLHEESSQRQLWPRVCSFGASEARRSLIFKEGTAITGYTMDQSVWVWVDLLRCGFRVGKKVMKTRQRHRAGGQLFLILPVTASRRVIPCFMYMWTCHCSICKHIG